MNRKTFYTVATALIAIASAASAVAGDTNRPANGENAFEISAPFTSTASRATVRLGAVAAAHDGSHLINGEKSGEIDAPFTSTLSRAQVRAETLAAIRLGAINFGGDYSQHSAPSLEQLDSIRMAGQKALSLTVASR